MRTIALIAASAALALAFPQHSHHDAVNSRGDKVMGFSHDKTTHHFTLAKDGGAIEVTVRDNADATQLAGIREHLKKVARSFAAGDLTMPMLIHNTDIPGLAAMKRLHSNIQYAYAEIPAGGSVTIRSRDRQAVEAIHSFLKFQITDHQTGDPLGTGMTTCAVMGGKVDIAKATKDGLYADYNGSRYYFCCGGCPDTFKADPKKFASAPHFPIPK